MESRVGAGRREVEPGFTGLEKIFDERLVKTPVFLFNRKLIPQLS